MDADRPLMDGMYPSRSEQIKKYLGILVALVIAVTFTAWRIGRWEARRDTREALVAIFDDTRDVWESAGSIEEQIVSAEDEDTLLLALCAKLRWWDANEYSLQVMEERLRQLDLDHLSAEAQVVTEDMLSGIAGGPAEMDEARAAAAAIGGCQGSD